MRRYGRNQKRAHRARIAELEQALAESDNKRRAESIRAVELVTVARRLRNEIDDARAILGGMSAAFAPDERAGMLISGGDRQSVYAMQIEPTSFTRSYGATATVQQSVRLDILATRVIESRQEIRSALHAIVEIDGKRAGMAISREAIATVPHHILARRMADEIAHALVCQLKGPWPR